MGVEQDACSQYGNCETEDEDPAARCRAARPERGEDEDPEAGARDKRVRDAGLSTLYRTRVPAQCSCTRHLPCLCFPRPFQREEWAQEKKQRDEAEKANQEKVTAQIAALAKELKDTKDLMTAQAGENAAMQNEKQSLETELDDTIKKLETTTLQLKHERAQSEHSLDKAKQDMEELHKE